MSEKKKKTCHVQQAQVSTATATILETCCYEVESSITA